MSAVLEFMTTTGAQRRPRAEEQEQKEKKSSRNEMWSLNEKRLEGSK